MNPPLSDSSAPDNPFGTPASSLDISSGEEHLTVAQLANRPAPKKPFPVFLVSLIIVSLIAFALLIALLFSLSALSRLKSVAGLNPDTLTVYIQRSNSAPLALASSDFLINQENNSLEIPTSSLINNLVPDNPVLTSGSPSDSETSLNLPLLHQTFVSSLLPDSRRLLISTENGKISSCFFTTAPAPDLLFNPFTQDQASSESCSLPEIKKPLYKLAELSPAYVLVSPPGLSSAVNPLTSSQTCLAFIYTDGSVDYLPLSSAPNFSELKPLNFSGRARDIIPVTTAYAPLSEHQVEKSSAIVLFNGTFILFDRSML